MSSLGRLKVLVVEDDVQVARAVQRVLRARAAKTTRAANCAQARALDDRFDVGVFDIDLPDGDGVQVAEELLRRGTVDLVVFFSGQDDPALVRRAHGVAPFVRKGDGAEALLEAIGVAMLGEMRAVAVGEAAGSPGGRRKTAPSGVRRRAPR